MTIRFIHLGASFSPGRLEVIDPDLIDPDLIGLEALNLDISDIDGVKHRLDLWGCGGDRNLGRDVHLRCSRLACRILRERRRAVVGARSEDRLDRKHVVRIGLFRRLRGIERLRGLHWRGPLLQCHPHLTMRRCCG